MMKFPLLIIVLATLLISCDKEEGFPVSKNAKRTVLVYMAGENNLTGDYLQSDLQEMRIGSKTISKDYNLIAYVDDASKVRKPYLLRIVNGVTADSIPMKEDGLTSDPEVFRNILLTVLKKYPAEEFGLCMWGHGNGWFVEQDSVEERQSVGKRRKAYGLDNGNNGGSVFYGKWMNLNTMVKVLEDLPQKPKYIFFDCCNMITVEVAYAMRHTTDYLIGSPAEIPGYGAPYQTVVPAMMADNFETAIIDNYFAYYENQVEQVPLSVVKTSEMDNLAMITKEVLYHALHDEPGLADISGMRLINYYRNKILDMNNYMLYTALNDDYDRWKEYADKAIIHKRMAKRWQTMDHVDFSKFVVEEGKYIGLGMYIPQLSTSHVKENKDIKETAWYQAAGYSDIGW